MTWWLGLGFIVFTQCRMSLGHFRQKTRVKHIVITSPLGSLLSIFAVYDFMCLPLWVLKLSNFLSPIVLLKLLRMRYILHISVGIGDCTQIPILIQLHILYDFFLVVILIHLPQFRCYKVQNKETLLDWPVSR